MGFTQVLKNAISNPGLALENAGNRYNEGGLYAALTPQSAYTSPLVQASGSIDVSSGMTGHETGYVPKEDGGFDFYLNGSLVSASDYYGSGNALPDGYTLDANGNLVKSQTPTNQTGATFTPHYLNGQLYNDPIAYANAVTEASLTEFNRQNKLLTDAYNAGLLDFATYQDQIKQARDTIKQQYGDAMGSISGRFSNISADAYQSAQGSAEGKAKDITNQNYANVANEEANLGLQRSQYDQDYANNLEANRVASQNQIDQTLNNTSESLAGTQYANSMNKINAPKLNTMSPMDSSILGVYDNLSQLSAGGNQPAIKNTIDNLQAEPQIKDWLYTRFAKQY